MVSFQGHLSDMATVTVGMPQGPILGPLFLIILNFMNDISLNIGSDDPVDMYADDCTVSASGNTLEHLEASLNNDLGNVLQWCDVSRMVINTDKTKVMMIMYHSAKVAKLERRSLMCSLEGRDWRLCGKNCLLGDPNASGLALTTRPTDGEAGGTLAALLLNPECAEFPMSHKVTKFATRRRHHTKSTQARQIHTQHNTTQRSPAKQHAVRQSTQGC